MRPIPLALQEVLDTNTPTICRLLRILTASGQTYGLCSLDRDVAYNHGDGEVIYRALNGFDPSVIESDVSYGVTNAEGYALIAGSVPGVTVEMIESGHLDDATWTMFLVNYEDPATGTALILDAGDLGEVRIEKAMVWIPELLSYSMRLRQPVGSVWQRMCRAIYGTPRDAPNRLGCGYDLTDDWTDFTVTDIGTETDRLFGMDAVNPTAFPYFPGRVIWTGGDNAGPRVYAVESADAESGGYQIGLMDNLPNPIQIGDTGQIVPWCPQTPEACKARNNYLNYNGEDHTPVGDAAAGTVPGGGLPNGGGYVGTTPPEEAVS